MEGYQELVARLLARAESGDAVIQSTFQTLLKRKATRDECAHAVEHLAAAKDNATRRIALEEIIRAIINSDEFQTAKETRLAPR